MKTKYIIGALVGLTTIASAAVAYGASKAYDKSYTWGIDQAKKNRDDKTVRIFAERDAAKAEAQVIFDRENKEVAKQESHIRSLYDAQVRKTDKIMQAERYQTDRHVAEAESKYNEYAWKCSEIRSNEQSRLEELIEHDGEYKAYKETKKTRKKAGKSTDKIDAKLERRKDELMENIVNSRSEEERKAFEQRDFYAREKENSREYLDSLIRQRSKSDQAEFEELKRLDSELRDRKSRKAKIEATRTQEEQAKVDRYKDLRLEVKEIETAEAKGIDRTKAMAGYLVNDGWTPVEIAVLGSIPLVAATGAFVWLASKYIGKLHGLVKAMRAC